MAMASASEVRPLLSQPTASGKNEPITRPRLYDTPYPVARTALGYDSEIVAPIPENTPCISTPSGKPRNSIDVLLTGITI
ncbi:hypothetical protein D3C85_1371050 [compost metagenome]